MDESKKPEIAELLAEVLVPLTVWAVSRMIERPQRKAPLTTRIARTAREVRSKATGNRIWIAAGAAAFIVGISFFARASKRK